MLNQFADHLRKRFKERYSVMAESIVSGNVVTLDDYKYRVGVIKGLAEAERELDELMLAYERKE